MQVDTANKQEFKLVYHDLCDSFCLYRNDKGLTILEQEKTEYNSRLYYDKSQLVSSIKEKYFEIFKEPFSGLVKIEEPHHLMYEFVNCFPKNDESFSLKRCNLNDPKFYSTVVFENGTASIVIGTNELYVLNKKMIFLNSRRLNSGEKIYSYLSENGIIESSIFLNDDNLFFELFELTIKNLIPKFTLVRGGENIKYDLQK